MTHLTDEQLVDAADRTLSPAPSAHVAHCLVCAKKVEALRRTLDAVRSDDVPEPSPVFWNGFAARVRSASEAPAVQERTWARPAWRWAFAAAAVLIVALGLRFATWRPTPNDDATTVAQHEDMPDAAMRETGSDDVDDAWTIVESLAAEWHLDEARDAGVMPRPGSIERAATELSPEARAELVRLLEDELKRTGA